MRRKRIHNPWEDLGANIPVIEGPQAVAGLDITGNDIWIQMRKGRIIDFDGNNVPFEPFPTQRRLLEKLCDVWDQKRPYRLIILKARRMGTSAGIENFYLSICLLVPNQFALVAAHEIDAARDIFAMTQMYEMELPDENRKPLRYNNARRMEWEKPHYSRIRVATANRKELGRASGFRLLHCSEVAFWDRPSAALAVSQTVPKTPRTFAIWESTANSVNEFFDKWEQANDKEILSEFEPLFIDWRDFPFYSIPLYQGETLKPSPEEAAYIEENELNDEQAKWYMTTKNDDCGGSQPDFDQEYPSTPERAFKASGNPFFNQDIIKTMFQQAKEPEFIGDIVWEEAA